MALAMVLASAHRSATLYPFGADRGWGEGDGMARSPSWAIPLRWAPVHKGAIEDVAVFVVNEFFVLLPGDAQGKARRGPAPARSSG